MPAELLTFEITESQRDGRSGALAAGPARAARAWASSSSVDDFGTGYSSLAYLRRLPIDEIKIDKSFVQGMVHRPRPTWPSSGRSSISGHSLGLRVVAEGVEEEAARDALRAMGCDGVQGFLISRPLPIDRFEAWLPTRTVSIGDRLTAQVLRMIG